MSETKVIIVPDNMFEVCIPYLPPVTWTATAKPFDPMGPTYQLFTVHYNPRLGGFPPLMLPDSRVVMVKHVSDKEKVSPENSADASSATA